MNIISQLSNLFHASFAYQQWWIFVGLSFMLFATQLIMFVIIGKRQRSIGHVFLTILSTIHFIYCFLCALIIKSNAPMFIPVDDVIKLAIGHIVAAAIMIVIYRQRFEWIRVIALAGQAYFMMMFLYIHIMWFEMEYIPFQINTEFENASQEERERYMDSNIVSSHTGMNFPQTTILDYHYYRMGPDFVEEYKFKFKGNIPKETLKAMDDSVKSGSWLKLKSGAYFMPERDYRDISPKGMYIFPKTGIVRYADDGGTNGFFGSPDDYEFMLP